MKQRYKRITVIDCAKWWRGQGRGLLRHGLGDKADGAPGAMCCLGFECIRRGVPTNAITGRDMPSAVYKRWFKVLDGLAYVKADGTVRNTWVGLELATVNDYYGDKSTETKRRARVVKLFAKIGTKIKFVNIGKWPKGVVRRPE